MCISALRLATLLCIVQQASVDQATIQGSFGFVLELTLARERGLVAKSSSSRLARLPGLIWRRHDPWSSEQVAAMADLSRVPGYKRLQPGDPYTFLSLSDEQMRLALDAGVGEHTLRWFSTAEPGRLFRIVRIHEALHAIECEYVGFQEVSVGSEADDQL